MELYCDYFFFRPLFFERPHFQSVQHAGGIDELYHVSLAFFPDLTLLQLFFGKVLDVGFLWPDSKQCGDLSGADCLLVKGSDCFYEHVGSGELADCNA